MAARHRLAIAGAVLLAAAQPWLPEFWVSLLDDIGIDALVAVGLVLLTGVGGLTSFGQAAFVGIGAYTAAYLSTAHSMSPWGTLLVGMGLTSAVALFLGAITLRLSGHFLPLGTIAWGLSLYFLFGNLEMLGGHSGLGGIAPVAVFGWELRSARAMYYLIWAVLFAAILTSERMLDSRSGRAMRSLRSPVMSQAMGVPVTAYRAVLFLIAAQLACVAGWLYAHLQRFVSPTPFSLAQGIEFLFMAVLGGIANVWGAVFGAAFVVVLKHLLQDWLPQLVGKTANLEMVAFGLLMIVVLHGARDGFVPALLRRWPRRATPPPVAPAAPLARRAPPPRGSVVLDARAVTKRYGGLVANRAMSLTVHAGEVLALIGPNGAGKSTMFNGISGMDPPDEGEIHFLGRRIDGLAPAAIAGLGLSRTFQHVRLNAEMSVLDNVAIGAHLRGRRNFLQAAWGLDRDEERRLLAEAARQLARSGLAARQFEPAGNLALGQQRIVEIARALASDPALLLLDEPAAGLRHQEKLALAALLGQLRDEGLAILLVEHDMDFVMGLADQVVVMEFGQRLAQGLPEQIQCDPQVLQAYLGGAIG